MTELLTVADIGKILGVSRPTAYQLVHQEGFPKIQVGRTIRIPADGFQRWIERQSEGKA
jgi:excisionase family DNA binding protein